MNSAPVALLAIVGVLGAVTTLMALLTLLEPSLRPRRRADHLLGEDRRDRPRKGADRKMVGTSDDDELRRWDLTDERQD